MKIRRSNKRLLLVIALVTYLTGALLYGLSGWVRVSTTVGEQHHPLEYWMRVLHNSATYGIVLAMGYLLKGHVLPGLRSRTRKRVVSGVSNLAVFALLVGSALVILYASENGLRLWSTRLHVYLGLICPLALVFHSRARRSPGQPVHLHLKTTSET